jgi:DNA replication protein DnaC
MINIGDVASSFSLLHQGASTPEGIEVAREEIRRKQCLCNPDCPTCHGIGYVRYDVDITDPRFGKMYPCPNTLWEVYGKKIGLDLVDKDLTWESLVDMNDIGTAAEAVKEVLNRGFGWVYIWGDYGVAKSLVLKIAVATAVRETGNPIATYVRMAELLDNLRAAFDTNNPSEQSQVKMDWWTNVKTLCIDEFDRIRDTAYSTERRFVLMDRRYEDACARKSITIISSNGDPAMMDGYLRDRIFDGRFKVIHIAGKSVRPMMTY